LRDRHQPIAARLGLLGTDGDVLLPEVHIHPLEAENLTGSTRGLEHRDDDVVKMRRGGLEEPSFFVVLLGTADGDRILAAVDPIPRTAQLRCASHLPFERRWAHPAC